MAKNTERKKRKDDQILNVFQPQEDTKYLPLAASSKYTLIFEKWMVIIAAVIIYWDTACLQKISLKRKQIWPEVSSETVVVLAAHVVQDGLRSKWNFLIRLKRKLKKIEFYCGWVIICFMRPSANIQIDCLVVMETAITQSSPVSERQNLSDEGFRLNLPSKKQ